MLTSSQLGVAWFFGARFDLAFKSIVSGNYKQPASEVLAAASASKASASVAAAASSAIESVRDEL